MKKNNRYFILTPRSGFRFYIGVIFLSFFISQPVLAAGQLGLYAKLYQPAKAAAISITAAPAGLANESSASGPNQQDIFSLNLSQVRQGAVLTAFNQAFKIILNLNSLSRPTDIEVLQINEAMPLPWNLRKVSKIYQYDLADDTALIAGQSLQVQISYDQANSDYKQIFYYDRPQNAWKPLPSQDYPDQQMISATVSAPFARLAIFTRAGVMTQGQASWYAYKGGDLAASPDFPKGSIIKVINIDNNKTVTVTVNDWGPDRVKFPQRAIDLDKTAFVKIASLGAGVINVRLEPIFVAPDSQGRVLGVKAEGMSSQPAVTAKSAVIMDQAGNILLDKNSQQSLALASLSKLMAVWVFLDTKPGLFQKVEYKLADEQYNYQYCQSWESAKVNLQEGEQILVKDLIYASLVRSANNAVESLARASGLERPVFIARMNQQAIVWGANQTHFVEPTGLSPNNVSSARDYAIIIKEALANPIISQASIAPSYKFTTLNTKREISLTNVNKLISNSAYPQIVGAKTGYLHEAGHCLAVKIKANDNFFYIVSLGAASRDVSANEIADLITYAVNNL